MVTPSPLPTAVCNLVTKSAIEAVVGQTLNDPQQSKVIDEGGVTKQSCLWTAANGEYAPTISITIIRVGTPETVADQMATAAAEVTASAVARQWQAEKNKTQTQARFETINNLGEAAYSNATGVHVLAADQALTVLVSLKSSGSNRSVAEQLARQIVPLLQ